MRHDTQPQPGFIACARCETLTDRFLCDAGGAPRCGACFVEEVGELLASAAERYPEWQQHVTALALELAQDAGFDLVRMPGGDAEPEPDPWPAERYEHWDVWVPPDEHGEAVQRMRRRGWQNVAAELTEDHGLVQLTFVRERAG